MQWIEFTIKTSSAAAEVVAERLAQLGAAGIATEDPQELEKILVSDDDTLFVEPDFVDSLPSYTKIRSYFKNFPEGIAWVEQDGPGVFSNIDTESVYAGGRFPKGRSPLEDFLARLESELQYISGFLPIGPAEISHEVVDELAWRDKWKENFHPQHISKRLFVSPSWIDFKGPAGAKVISMDPGSAFGSGSHETTQLCAEYMDTFINPSSKVLDLGTGSGILAIGAALLGARKVKALDVSSTAIETCTRNVANNNVQARVACEMGELHQDTEKYNLITANLIAEVLIDLAPEFKAHLADLGILICSGIVNSKKDAVLKAFRREGYHVFAEEERNEWNVIVFSR